MPGQTPGIRLPEGVGNHPRWARWSHAEEDFLRKNYRKGTNGSYNASNPKPCGPARPGAERPAPGGSARPTYGTSSDAIPMSSWDGTWTSSR